MQEKHRIKSLLLGFLVSPHCYSTNRCSRVGPTLHTESGGQPADTSGPHTPFQCLHGPEMHIVVLKKAAGSLRSFLHNQYINSFSRKSEWRRSTEELCDTFKPRCQHGLNTS